MKASLLIVFIFLSFIAPSVAQEEKFNVSHINRGETFLNFQTQVDNKYKIKNSFYKTYSLKVGGGYYFVKRLAVKATLARQHYTALELVTPTQKEFNKKNLLLFTGQLRYNFWEAKSFVTTFVQTGYALGQFPNVAKLNIKRWEIVTIGETFYFPEKIIPKLNFEASIGLEIDNLNQKKAFPILLGLNYYFGNSNIE